MEIQQLQTRMERMQEEATREKNEARSENEALRQSNKKLQMQVDKLLKIAASRIARFGEANDLASDKEASLQGILATVLDGSLPPEEFGMYVSPRDAAVDDKASSSLSSTLPRSELDSSGASVSRDYLPRTSMLCSSQRDVEHSAADNANLLESTNTLQENRFSFSASSLSSPLQDRGPRVRPPCVPPLGAIASSPGISGRSHSLARTTGHSTLPQPSSALSSEPDVEDQYLASWPSGWKCMESSVGVESDTQPLAQPESLAEAHPHP